MNKDVSKIGNYSNDSQTFVVKLPLVWVLKNYLKPFMSDVLFISNLKSTSKINVGMFKFE